MGLEMEEMRGTKRCSSRTLKHTLAALSMTTHSTIYLRPGLYHVLCPREEIVRPRQSCVTLFPMYFTGIFKIIKGEIGCVVWAILWEECTYV